MKGSDKLKRAFCESGSWMPPALVVLLGIVAYANSFQVPVQYDDIVTLRTNLSDLLKGSVRWVPDLTFALNRMIHGETVAGYHAVNLAIHLAAALCVYWLALSAIAALRSSFELPSGDEQLPFLQTFVPFSTAAIFVCHPVQTQAITYISQRYTALAILFYLASVLTYIRSRLRREGGMDRLLGGGSLVLALLAMMSKETAFTLPLMVIVIEAVLFRGRLLKNPLFLMVCAALLTVIPLQVFLRGGGDAAGSLLDSLQRVSAETVDITRSEYFLTQLRVVVTYLRLLVVPVNQNLDYDYPVEYTLSLPVLASLALHLTLAAGAVHLFRRSRAGLQEETGQDGILLRLAALGIVWFYLALAVESSIIPIRDVIFEHRLYLPSVGIILAASCLAAVAVRRATHRTVAWWLVAACCIVFTSTTIARNRVWGSQMTLWQDVVAKSPNKARVNYNVGLHYLRRGMPAQSLPYMVKALELAPEENINYWIYLNGVIFQLNMFERRSSTGLQYQASERSVDPRYKVPWQAVSYNNLGLAYEYLGNLQAALANFDKAAAVDPALDLAWYNLAVTAARLHDPTLYSQTMGRLQALNPALARSAETRAKSPNTMNRNENAEPRGAK